MTTAPTEPTLTLEPTELVANPAPHRTEADSPEKAPDPMEPARRCAFVLDGEPCTSVLGHKRILCPLCDGSLCWDHCGGICHFTGSRLVSRGGTATPGRGDFEWMIREVAANRFRGQLWRIGADGRAEVVHNSHSDESGAALREINSALAKLHGVLEARPAVRSPLVPRDRAPVVLERAERLLTLIAETIAELRSLVVGHSSGVEFDPRLCAYCGQLVAAGSGSEQPGGKLAHVACQDAQKRGEGSL